MRRLFALLFLGVLNVQVAFAANPTLTLRKVVQNNSAGTAAATQWTLSAVGPNGLGGFVGNPVGTPTDASLGPTSVAPARYFLGETGPGGVYLPGYSVQIDLPSFSFWDCNGGGVQDRNSITLAADEVVTCTITNIDTPDPDLPGALATLESIPSGSLIIPMDTALQIDDAGTNAAEDAFNLTAYGLVNKLLQNNIPVKWAIRADKKKIVGDTTGPANSLSLIDATKNFITLGVQVGDLVTNASNGFTRTRVTAVAATTLTLVAVGGDPIDFDLGDDYVIDYQDFTATAERIRPGVDVPAASVAFAGGPFIVSSQIPALVARALEIIDGIDDGVPPLIPQFNANASQTNVRVYRTTAITNNVDIRYNLTHKPFIAVSDFNTTIHSDVLLEAGIPGILPGKNVTGCSPLPGQPGFDPNTCNWVQINPVNLSALECATIHLEPHRDGQAQGFTIDDIGDAVENFVTGGGNMFVQCHGVEYFENHNVRIDPDEKVQGVYLTTLGASKQDDGTTLTYPHPEMAINQITGPLDPGQGGSVPDWLLPDGGSYKNNGYIGAQHIGVGSNIHTAANGKAPTGSGVGGNVFYLGGHSYSGDDLDQRNGRRMLLNALFVPPDRPSECGLTINATLTLQKRVVNDDGGVAGIDDFTLDTDAGLLDWDAGVADGPDTTLYTAQPFTVLALIAYAMSDNEFPGYTRGAWSCVGGDGLGGGQPDTGTVTLNPGESKTCTITNNDIASSPAIDIEKQGSLDVGADFIANPGDIITYGFSVTNLGDTVLTSVAVTDPLVGLSAIDCSPEANPIASIAVGADPVICSATYAITQADIDAGLRDNTATATGQCAAPIVCPVTDEDPVEVPIPASPAVTIDKEGIFDQGGDATSTVGDIISYTFDVTNTGNMTLTNVAVTDPLITDPPNSGTIDCTPEANPIATLAPGATVQCTATYAITQADLDAASRENTATVTGDCTSEEDCPVTDDDPETVEIPTDASIDLIKTLEASAVLELDGSYTVLYTIQAVNSGNALGTYDLIDTFSPGSGITLNTATAVYSAGTENSQTGTTGAYPNFVTGETLGAGLDESWDVTANFTVDPADVDPVDSQCDPAEPVIDTGFYNLIEGVTDEEDTTNNDACDGLPPPDINLAKTLVGPATAEADGTYTVVYTITATNNGDGPGFYDLVDTFSPAAGITLNEATALYVAGTESNQSGATGDYPNFVTGEALAATLDESWTVTANFTIDLTTIADDERFCDPAEPTIDTGFYNAVSGVTDETDTTDNDTCTDLPDADINLAKVIVGPAVEQPDASYTVEYTITATNTGDGPGLYDLVDTFSPAVGITLNTATAVYVAGTENSQTGTTGAYPNFVTDEQLGGTLDESWTVTANFTVDPATLDPEDSFCDPAAPAINTGFYNAVSGVTDETDTTDNDACTPLQLITLVATPSCVNDVPWVNYVVTPFGFNPAPTQLTLTWINRDLDPDEIVSGPTVYTAFTEDVLWPGVTADGPDPGANGLTWPGWTESPPGTWTFDPSTNLVPNLALVAEVNPTDEVALIYPPAAPLCNPAPPAVLTVEKEVLQVLSAGTDLFDVTFRITANNTGGQSGLYDLKDTLFVDESLTPVTVVTALHHVPGTEATTDGTLVPATAAEYAAGATVLTGESLGAGLNESWEVTIQFQLDPATVTPESADCTVDGEGDNTGFTNQVELLVDQVVVDEADACEPIPLPTERTTFRVIKDFTDDNPMDVNVEISCFTGLPLIQNQDISETRDVVFVVTEFDPGELDCEIFEVVPEGYSPTYTAEALENGIAGGITSDDEGCQFTEVESGEFQCSIVNTPDPVDVVIEKVWVVDGNVSDVIDMHYTLELFCDAEIVGGSQECGLPDANSPAGPAILDLWCITFEGDGPQTFTAHVIPEYPDSQCWVEETVFDDSVEIDNGCEEPFLVSAGHGNSCVVTNTVFFEGIPTLNQYGVAILALLMMGIGLVGFRRFV